ncbi:MAG: phosphoribosyl-ATP diphosphatase [Pseudomonadota bacterium]
MTDFTLADLDAILAKRIKAPASESYTASLADAGMAKAARKLGEESVETMIAALQDDRNNLTNEAADLLYHLLVVLRIGGVPLADVMDELRQRTGQSGLAEKASRPS